MVRSFYILAKQLSDLLIKIMETLCALALIFIVFSFGWLIFSRYILNTTPTWVEHVALLLIAMITFFMMAVNQRRDQNLAVGAITDRLPREIQEPSLIGVIAVKPPFAFWFQFLQVTRFSSRSAYYRRMMGSGRCSVTICFTALTAACYQVRDS